MFNALLGSFVAWSLTAGALPGPWPAAASLALGGALLLLLASLLGQGMNMYLFKDYFNSADMLSLVGFAGVLPMLALAPFAAKLSKRFGKKEAGCVGVGVAAAAYLLMWALRLRSVWAYIGLMLVGSVGVGFFNMVIWAFITDVIDYQEVRTGSRDDGTVYAVYSFARKLGQALAGGVVDPLPEDAPQFVADYYAYYKTPRGYQPRSLNSNGGWNLTSSLSFLNMPILQYSSEIRSAVLLVHGEKAHSRYFSETAYSKLTGDNKELLIIPSASHTDLYDQMDIIPFEKLKVFFEKYLK